MLVGSVGPAEAAAAAPSGAMEGMLSRKHEWESTTKKSNARSVVPWNFFVNTVGCMFLQLACNCCGK